MEMPLKIASKAGNVEIVKCLIENGASTEDLYSPKILYSPIVCAVREHNVEVVKYFISIDAELDYALKEAASCCFIDLIDILINAGANIHGDIICYQNIENFGVIRHLIEIGADPTMALNMNVSYASEEIVRYFIEKGANLYYGTYDTLFQHTLKRDFSIDFYKAAISKMDHFSDRDVIEAVSNGQCEVHRKESPSRHGIDLYVCRFQRKEIESMIL